MALKRSKLHPKVEQVLKRCTPQESRDEHISEGLDILRRMIPLADRLPAILHGKAKPSDAEESLLLACLCHFKGYFATSAKLFRDAFQSKPGLADIHDGAHRSMAAGSAALASCVFLLCKSGT